MGNQLTRSNATLSEVDFPLDVVPMAKEADETTWPIRCPRTGPSTDRRRVRLRVQERPIVI